MTRNQLKRKAALHLISQNSLRFDGDTGFVDEKGYGAGKNAEGKWEVYEGNRGRIHYTLGAFENEEDAYDYIWEQYSKSITVRKPLFPIRLLVWLFDGHERSMRKNAK